MSILEGKGARVTETHTVDPDAIRGDFLPQVKTQISIIAMTIAELRNLVTPVQEWARLVDVLDDQFSVLCDIITRRAMLNGITDVEIKPEYTNKKGGG